MIRLAAFADEISPNLDEQITVLREQGIRHVELRSVWDTNVLDLSDHQVDKIRRAFSTNGIGVAAIGSPVGKEPADRPVEEVLARLDRAVALARACDTRLIRIFSFYPPRESSEDYRGDVVTRLRALTERAGEADIILLHENDTGLYGDTVARCLDLLTTIDDERLGAAFDPANFIQSGERPIDGYEPLRPWIAHVHVKDVRPDRTLAPAGEGSADWPELLRRLRADGYDGILSLEPHLVAGGPYGGYSGPDLFRVAARSLQRLLDTMGWEYE